MVEIDIYNYYFQQLLAPKHCSIINFFHPIHSSSPELWGGWRDVRSSTQLPDATLPWLPLFYHQQEERCKLKHYRAVVLINFSSIHQTILHCCEVKVEYKRRKKLCNIGLQTKIKNCQEMQIRNTKGEGTIDTTSMTLQQHFYST